MGKFEAKAIGLKLLLSLPLLWVLNLSFQQYQLGLLENKANKLFPKLVEEAISVDDPILNKVIVQLEAPGSLVSLRLWQRGLLYEWLGGRDNLILALSEIKLALEQRPGWPLMWRDLIRINIKLGAPVEVRTALLERFQRVGEWNRQSVLEISRFMLLIWEHLSIRERNWLLHHAATMLGEELWLEQTRELTSLNVIPMEVCIGEWHTMERASACKVGKSVK